MSEHRTSRCTHRILAPCLVVISLALMSAPTAHCQTAVAAEWKAPPANLVPASTLLVAVSGYFTLRILSRFGFSRGITFRVILPTEVPILRDGARHCLISNQTMGVMFQAISLTRLLYVVPGLKSSFFYLFFRRDKPLINILIFRFST
jgi:hypothetical protein